MGHVWDRLQRRWSYVSFVPGMRAIRLNHIICLLVLFTALGAKAQNMSINNSGADPDSSAMLDITSPDKGILIPRTDTAALNSNGFVLPTGLMIFQTLDNNFYYFDGASWKLVNATNMDDQTLSFSNDTLYVEDGNAIYLGAYANAVNNDNDPTNELQSLSFSTTTLSISSGNSVNLSSLQDDLGDHTADQNIELNGHWLSNDGGNEGVFVTTGGNVGVGDNSLVESFEVQSNTDRSAVIGRSHVGYMGHSDWAGFSHFDQNGTSSYALMQNGSGRTLLNAANGQSIDLRINNSSQVFLNSSGRLGINETSPQTTLDVKDYAVVGNINVGNQSTDQGTSIHNGDGFLTTPWLYSNAIEAPAERGAQSTLITVGNDGTHGADDEIHLVTNGNSQVEVNSSGNVGIGVSPSSGSKLEVDGDVEADDYLYTSTQTRYLNIPRAAWIANNTASYNMLSDLQDVGIQGNVSGYPTLLAPIHLPQGATITQVQANVYDNSSHNIDVRIYRNDWNSSSLSVIMNILTSSGTPGFTTLSTTSAWSTGYNIIDNANYNYYALIQFSSQSNGTSLSLRGLRITYTVSEAD